MMGLMPTIADLAAHLGLSTYTVSCALRGVGAVAPATRARIKATAASLGYRPNGAAALLARQRHRQVRRQVPVAWLMPDPFSEEYFWRAFRTTCRDLGLEATALHYQKLDSPAHLVAQAFDRGCEALFFNLSDLPWPREDFTAIDWSPFVVLKDSRLGQDCLPFHLIRHDPFLYMLHTLEQCLAHGYRRMAVLLSDSPVDEDNLARLGAVHAFVSHHLPPGGQISVRHGLQGLGEGMEDDLDEWLRAENPEAVIAFPIVWYWWLTNRGWRIPHDVAFAGVLTYRMRDHSLAGCDAQRASFGRRAAHRIFRLLESGERGCPHYPVEDVVVPRWINGESLPVRG